MFAVTSDQKGRYKASAVENTITERSDHRTEIKSLLKVDDT